MTIEEYEDKLFNYAEYFRMRIASDKQFDEAMFTKFVDCLSQYSKICIKIAETQVYKYLTIKSAKDVVEKFKLILAYLNAMIRQLHHESGKKEDIQIMMKNFLKLKTSFENVVSCCDNYLLKQDGRTYGIIQDDSINKTCVLILRLFGMMAKLLKKTNSYNSFVMDIERMEKRYNYFNNLKTFVLEDADVVSK